MNLNEIVFIDAEVDHNNEMIVDIGAVSGDGREFHSNSPDDLAGFLRRKKYICGHNIFRHDLRYLGDELARSGISRYIDTLYLSPLVFPKKPYHSLVKDDKLETGELNNPLNDAKKARDLFHDEAAEFGCLDENLQIIYYSLLKNAAEFKDFFHNIGFRTTAKNASALIRETFAGRICDGAPVKWLVDNSPVELAYALSQVGVIEYDSLTPPWVLKNYPRVENALHVLRSRKCTLKTCGYCGNYLDESKALKKFFQYDGFRSYDGMPLQHSVVKAAVSGKSPLAVFPTAGGKSIAFQLPALMAGVNEKGLTVVISPLQSLMKDQTDNLENKHSITEAVTINGSLDPLERAKAFERVEDGTACILYISPESLRSKSIERLLLGRNVVRFVIDEAHCFSSWGQDFRVDYLYIGEFIRSLQEQKEKSGGIPISCFTATAKQRVIADIREYFKAKLSLDLELFRANVARPNLNYHVFYVDGDDEKYFMLRRLIADNDCPAIVYVSFTRRAEDLAKRLTEDGFPAKCYHGRMDRYLRVTNQEMFMNGEVRIIVATAAFGMGVDKKDVGMVVHYDISNSLEDYVQEAGRAGRDENISADCYILYNDDDMNKHFNLLNQSKLSLKEIQQVWKALKELTRIRMSVSQSALEIARASGWDDSVSEIETRVRTAISALEQSGFVRRGQNMPRIYADSILVKNMQEARAIIDSSPRFDDETRQHAIRIIANLISAKSKSRGAGGAGGMGAGVGGGGADGGGGGSGGGAGETRVDYISDKLGIVKEDVIRAIGLMREERILADAKDLFAYIKKGEKSNRSKEILTLHKNIESCLYTHLKDTETVCNIKELNEKIQAECPGAAINQLNTMLNYLAIKHLFRRRHSENKHLLSLKPYFPIAEIITKSEKRYVIAYVIIDYLYTKALGDPKGSDVSKAASAAVSKGAKENAFRAAMEITLKAAKETAKETETAVNFSVLELKSVYEHNIAGEKAGADEIEDALYFLLKIGALKIEGGFLVIYNTMRIERLKKGSHVKYKKEDYAQLEDYYRNKRQQIHIAGEYANRMIEDYNEAMAFVNDYFMMDYESFLQKYFMGRRDEINKSITPRMFRQLFGELSPAQLKIINDRKSGCIVVAAGPGSGKTKLLTHKLASLYAMEDVKHEQMLMLTFSRAAATEFKKRLAGLIGNAANYIQITTFHSYCFDLLGKVGDLEKSDQIVAQTVDRINAGEAELSRLTKTVLVIDEAQDMSAAEYTLVKTLMEKNEGMRIIAVGDDDQNIYEFRGSRSEYFEALMDEPGAKKYELVQNYRGSPNIVDFANQFARGISRRFKTFPIIPVKKENGVIGVCRLASDNIAVPAANLVLTLMQPDAASRATPMTPVVTSSADLKDRHDISSKSLSGTTCVVTRTNEEALNITGLLLKGGVAARIIRAETDFSLYNLAELHDFIADIESGDDSYAITDENWRQATQNLNRNYEGSADLPNVNRLIDEFEAVCGNTKYKSDLRQYVAESRLEDFTSASGNHVYVSTIHQTKGREYDNIILALSRFQKMDDETMRSIYVAITRAKQNLHILCNGNYFERIDADGIRKSFDEAAYAAPDQITLQLSHKDVHLGYFAFVGRRADTILSGDEMSVSVPDAGCFFDGRRVLKFSARFCGEIDRLKEKGYCPAKAVVRHLAYWKEGESGNVLKIILPDIEFIKGAEPEECLTR